MELIINNEYKLIEKIGEGAYGMIYRARQLSTKKDVAVKLENVNAPIPQVYYEAKVYMLLQGNKGIPKLYWIGTEGDYNILIIENCGPSLESLRKYCKGAFSLKTTVLLTIQMIERIKIFHDHCLLHRDIKPDNFLIGSK